MHSNSDAMSAGQFGTTRPRGGIMRKIAVTLGLFGLGAAVATISIYITPGQAYLGTSFGKEAPAAAPAKPQWVAAAPGRIEPRSGQIRVTTAVLGRVTEVLVRPNNRVAEDEVLIRLDDVEARARLSAAEAEAAARKRERDSQPATAGREDVRKAEDAVFSAERAVTYARLGLDEAIISERKGNSNTQSQSQGRRRLYDARERLRQEQAAFAIAQSKGGVPGPNRFEAALLAARAEISMAEALLEKTRIRAPIAGTVLQINAKVGEMVAPSTELPLVMLGDMSVIRVRAEVDEQDVSKIKVGQRAYVRNNGYPGQEFEGKVAELAPSLAPPRMGSRGARRATDVEVMEVLIDLDGSVPLLPGMRAEAFFK
jgi:HlyD family secretion protein